jgi:intein/homing endonuclease
VNYRFTKDIFDHAIQQIKARFFEAIASPSEMVGVVAAQSIGEPATQLSCLKESKVLISTKDKSKSYYGTMGEFVDTLLKQNKDKVVDLGNDSVVFDPSEDYYIVGVCDKEQTSWKRILQVSRHPAHGGMVRVHTRSGKTTCATLSHSFLKRTTNSIVPVKGSELQVGDRIPITKHIPEVKGALTHMDGFALDKEFGWFIGMYLADGNINYHQVCISKIIPEVIDKVTAFARDRCGVAVKVKSKEGTMPNSDKVYTSVTTVFNHKELAKFIMAHFNTGSYKKAIPGWVFNSNLDFIKGIISGYFDGDGNVAPSVGKGMIRAHSVNESLIDGMIMMLAYTGIFASKSVETKNDNRENPKMFTIQISRKYAEQFMDSIGLVVNTKRNDLLKVIDYVNRDEAHSYGEYIDKIPELGDVIAFIGRELQLPGQSRNFGRWSKKESIGRSTLLKYITQFEEANADAKNDAVAASIRILKQAANSDIVWDEITHMEYLDDPMEYVYDFTVPGNDSFMVDCGVLVHNTLNSVEWNTEVLLDVNGKLERHKIGDIIDTIVEHADEASTERHEKDTTLVWIKEKNVKILSCNEDGKITWEAVEAVTKHPPINKDGTNTLLKVTLQSGREVIATKAKSFLKRHNNKIIEVEGDQLQVGDYLPVSSVLHLDTNTHVIDKLDLVLYENNVALDQLFGFIVGAYAIGGTTNDDGVVINTNNDKIVDFCTLHHIKYTTDESVVLHSSQLAQYLVDIIGYQQCDKRLPAWMIQTPIDFVKGVIDGYFSVQAPYASRGLSEDIQQLLTKLNIVSTIHPETMHVCVCEGEKRDMVPDIVTESHGIISMHRDKVAGFISQHHNKLTDSDKEVLNRVLQEDIMYDKVVSIEDFTSPYAYVYDLTVANTKNFNVYNGLAMRDTFHHSGISSASKAVRGVPRIKELLSVTKNIKAPSMMIYLKDEVKRDKMSSNKVLKSIHTTLFKDIVKSSKVYFDADDFNTDIEDDKQFLDTYKELMNLQVYETVNTSPWLLRIEIDRERLLDEGLNMLMLYSVLTEYYGDTISCMFSDDNSHNLVFRIKLPDDATPDDEKDFITELKALEKNIMDNTIIKGVKNIQKAIMNKEEGNVYNKETMSFEKDHEWVISTAGTNMVDVLSFPGVDFTRSVSNDINEIYELLGIEAARQALYNELFSVIDSAELYVNYRHMALLVDTMTNRGYLLSIDRHGINRVDFGPLAKCSFEETTDMLIKAGIFAEVDKINGVSANIMLGQIPACGTGDCDVLIDEHKLMNTIMEECGDFEEQLTQDAEDLTVEEGDVCGLDKMTFNMTFDFSFDMASQPSTSKAVSANTIKVNVI